MRTCRHWVSCILAISFALAAAAQQPSNAPPIQWQNSFGGTNDDQVTGAAQLQDGSFVVAGNALSDGGGNKTVAGTGEWLVFMDANGSKTAEMRLTNSGNV